MQTQRITVPSLFTIFVGVSVCLLAFDAYSQTVRDNQSPHLTSANQGTNAGNSTDEGFHVALNKKPLADFITEVRKATSGGGLDVNIPASLSIEADRAPDGLLSNIEVTQSAGDARFKQLAANFATALSESHALAPFEEAKHVRITFNLDQSAISSSLLFKAKSVERAARMVKGYDALVHRFAIKKRGSDEGLILDSLNAASNDENVVISFAMRRDTFTALLSRMLATY